MLDFFKAKRTRGTVKIRPHGRGLLFFNPSPFRVGVFSLGTGLLLTAILYLLFIYYPLGKAFAFYKLGMGDGLTPPLPIIREVVNYDDFYIDIPKIKAAGQVFPNIPAGEKEIYLEVLKKGVAHAGGSGFPGEGKTIYLFAHSTNSPFNAVRYNAVFMLLNELHNEDTINVYFSGKTYIYKVYDKKIVKEGRTDYLGYQGNGEVLILQTCWPPGTTWNRLLVFAVKS